MDSNKEDLYENNEFKKLILLDTILQRLESGQVSHDEANHTENEAVNYEIVSRVENICLTTRYVEDLMSRFPNLTISAINTVNDLIALNNINSAPSNSDLIMLLPMLNSFSLFENKRNPIAKSTEVHASEENLPERDYKSNLPNGEEKSNLPKKEENLDLSNAKENLNNGKENNVL